MKTDVNKGHIQKITPFLWFKDGAEKAAEFYVNLFPNSRMLNITHYPKETEEVSGMEAGKVMTVEFELEGMKFSAINGGPPFELTLAISFVVNCKDQKEVDYYWNILTSDGGQEIECGWLTDKFGLSWQITPSILLELLSDPDPVKSGRVMGAMLKMKKIEIEPLLKAYNDNNK